MPYFSLEGLVGSGKSSVLKFLCGHKFGGSVVCQTLQEPAEQYRTYKNGLYNPLHEMQSDPRGNVACGQMHILDRSALFYQHNLTPMYPLVVSERSILSPYIFLDCYHREGHLSTFSKDYLVNEWRDVCTRIPQPHYIIFIDTPPSICRARILSDDTRSKAEKDAWNLEFLSNLRESHEKMFKICGKLLKRVQVDHNMTPSDTAFAVARIIAEESALSL